MTVEDQLKILTYYHLGEYNSVRHLLQEFEEDEFAQAEIAPESGIKKSGFFEAINSRGLMIEVFELLKHQASRILPSAYSNLGKQTAIDGSLIDGVASMEWAEYRTNSKKAKAHVVFSVNQRTPRKAFITTGKAGERPFVNQILEPWHISVTDGGISVIKLSICFRTKKNFLFVESGKTRQKPS